MHYAGWIGVGIVAVFLLVIPQLQYRFAPKDEDGKSAYFLEVEDYDKYAELHDAALGFGPGVPGGRSTWHGVASHGGRCIQSGTSF